MFLFCAQPWNHLTVEVKKETYIQYSQHPMVSFQWEIKTVFDDYFIRLTSFSSSRSKRVLGKPVAAEALRTQRPSLLRQREWDESSKHLNKWDFFDSKGSKQNPTQEGWSTTEMSVGKESENHDCVLQTYLGRRCTASALRAAPVWTAQCCTGRQQARLAMTQMEVDRTYS